MLKNKKSTCEHLYGSLITFYVLYFLKSGLTEILA